MPLVKLRIADGCNTGNKGAEIKKTALSKVVLLVCRRIRCVKFLSAFRKMMR